MESSTIQAHSASTTTETPDTPATREDAFDLFVGGVALGLPIPQGVDFYHFHALYLSFDGPSTDAVNRWAAYLSLPQPDTRPHIHGLDGDAPYRMYVSRDRATCLPGWTAEVSCHVAVTDAEITAARLVATDATVSAVTA